MIAREPYAIANHVTTYLDVRKLAGAMRIDPERVCWKLWHRAAHRVYMPDRFDLTFHIEGRIDKWTSDRFWHVIEGLFYGMPMGMGYDDRLPRERWDSLPSYDHNVLARGDMAVTHNYVEPPGVE